MYASSVAEWRYGVRCARGGSHAGCGLCAPAARGRGRGRGRESGEQRSGEGTGQRDSIADGTALRNIVGEEVAATFRDTEDFSPRALCLCRYAPPAPYSPFFFFACLFADTTLVRVTKPRFGSKYSGVLRSPQELKIIGGPTVVRSTPYFCPSKKMSERRDDHKT